MVTLQELQQREEELKRLETEALPYANKEIPRRRFGTPVTKRTQQTIIANREQANLTLSQINEQRQKIQEARAVLSEEQNREARIKSIRQLASRLDKYTSRELKLMGFSREDRDIYFAFRKGIQSGERYLKAWKERHGGNVQVIQQGKGEPPLIIKTQYQEGQELPPVRSIDYENAPPIKAVGYGVWDVPLSEIQSKAVYQTETQETKTPEQSKIKSMLIETEANLKASQKPTSNFIRGVLNLPVGLNIPRPIGFNAPQNKYTALGEVATEIQDLTNDIFDYGEGKSKERSFGSMLNKDTRYISEMLYYTATAPVTLPIMTLSGLNRIYNRKGTEQFIQGSLETAFGGLGLAGMFKGWLNQKVVIQKIEPVAPIPKSFTTQKTFILGSKVFDISAVSVAKYTPSSYEFKVSRGDLLFNRFISAGKPLRYQSTAPEDLLIMFPKGKYTQINRESVSFAITEPQVSIGGKVLGSTRGSQKVGVVSFKLSDKGISNVKFSGLTGDVQIINKLSKMDKKVLKDLEGLIRVKTYKPEKLDFNLGNVEVVDYVKMFRSLRQTKQLKTFGDLTFKISKSYNARILPYGKRTSRFTFGGIRRNTKVAEFETDFGVKSIETFQERLSGFDITFPKMKTPTKFLRIEGTGIRQVTEFPVKTDKGFMMFPSKPKPVTKQINKISELTSQSLIFKAFTKVNLKPIKISSSKVDTEFQRIAQLPKYVGGGGLSRSLFYGKGTYERTDLFQIPKPRDSSIMKPSFLSFETGKTRNEQGTRLNFSTRNLFSSREIPRLQPKERLFEGIKTEVVLKITPRLVPRTTLRKSPFLPKSPALRLRFDKSFQTSLGLKGIVPKPKEIFGKTLGYRTFFVKGGKKIYLEGLRSRSSALKFGQMFTLSNLRATFGIKKTPFMVKKDLFNFQVNEKIFRPYRIKKGKAIPLIETFIQRRSKRLVTESEKNELKNLRRLFGKIR